MAEQTFRSAGFFEQEIDLSSQQVSPSGTPAGVIGTSEKGPAFVPVTVGSFADFTTKFGGLDPTKFGPYAVKEFLKNKTSCTYLRVLGAGANETIDEISTTRDSGTVKNAGFRVFANATDNIATFSAKGAVQFLVGFHDIDANESAAFPEFTDNESFKLDGGDPDADAVNLVRSVIFTTTGSRIQVLNNSETWTTAARNSVAKVGAIGSGVELSKTKYFKLVVSTSEGPLFGNSENNPGVRIYTASLDPSNQFYVGNVLNTNPKKFSTENHLLYLDFPVENEIAVPRSDGSNSTVAIVSGTATTSGPLAKSFLELFGRFDTRYTTPKSPIFISQPYGTKEFDLFNVEALSDGEWANNNLKISIANIRASTDANFPYGTFELQVRAFDDSDTELKILEAFPNCSIDPKSERYIARIVGDKKVYYDFDQEDPNERRLVVSGKYPNVSSRIRVVMNEAVEKGEVPQGAIPFGFRGVPAINTNETLTDTTASLVDATGRTLGNSGNARLFLSGSGVATSDLASSIVPPLPFRFKVTRGVAKTSSISFTGEPGTTEKVDGRLYWGVKFERMPETGSFSNALLDPNSSKIPNSIVQAYTKLNGIEKLGTVITGSGKDAFNSNKFSLSRVAFSNVGTVLSAVNTSFTGTAGQHMLEAAYIRNGVPSPGTYTIGDGSLANRFTMASIVHTSSVIFNKFSEFNKFSTILFGGFDGNNILDVDASNMTDRAASSDTGGKGAQTGVSIGLAKLLTDGGTASSVGTFNPMGGGRKNNTVASYKKGIEILTDPMTSKVNILAVPGQRDSFITNHAITNANSFAMALYLMDLIKYDEDSSRLFDDSVAIVDVSKTSDKLSSRAIDSSYTSTFFPDVFIDDSENNRRVKVPASIAMLGVLAYNDTVAHPWFAPAGFDRGALEFVKNVETRLGSNDRDVLYDAKINPIAVFPNAGFVVFGQKTLQAQKSALDRINVRRLLLEVKRVVSRVAEQLLFEPNNSTTRGRFISGIVPLLATIQAQAGIDQFKVVCDESNNKEEDVASNKMNGRIMIVPTRVVEFVSVDFIVTSAGVIFV